MRRRDALLQAAIEIVGEAGAGAATHRAIAARAGVPLATTSYFFASIDHLLEEATRRFTAMRAAEIEAAADGLPDETSFDEVAALFAEFLLAGERSTELAQVEAYLHAARREALRSAVAGAMAAFEKAAERALAAAGAARPAEGARAFVALADGFVLGHLARPRPDDREVLAEALRSLFIAYLMETDERDRWAVRLGGRHGARAATSSPALGDGDVRDRR
ncbi:MAG TPA: TetR family transcriptional regulator [Acidimicrobiales bacterium]|nr:TetR family transcriptional regulator [Acidimicrobiales bacterium]